MRRGEFVAITGRSGAGKSTLLNLIGGLATPSAGRVVLDDTDMTRLNESERAAFRRQHIGIVYQTDNLVPFLTALENVELPMQIARHTDTARRARLRLAQVGLAERLHTSLRNCPVANANALRLPPRSRTILKYCFPMN